VKTDSPRPVLCPSARPDLPDSVAFGVVGGTVEQPRVAWLEKPVPVTDDLLALTRPVPPAQVLRFAAACQEKACSHFDGTDCRLATRLVRMIAPVVENLPTCHIRPDCRWFRQEGAAACRVCPQIVTHCANPSEAMDLAATPEKISEPG
jgi:hypothetical protein